MITQEKIKIYLKYDGDSDGWARSGSKKEKLAMTDMDWRAMDSFLQDLSLANNGLTSVEFNNRLYDELNQSCDGENAINLLKSMAGK